MFFPNKLHFSNFEVFSLDMAKGFVTEMSPNSDDMDNQAHFGQYEFI